ncbi:kelch-like protein 35 [Spea bombifrons]|uniref:kelch-like protein 35 n=1 Tax=Spea bombifrons TaxID=233779 RepID=UPI0023491FA8|nr:kelch-like protein 35 [Spea bombifrons]
MSYDEVTSWALEPLKGELDYETSHLENSIQDRGEKLHLRSCGASCHSQEILQSLNIYRKSGMFTDVVLHVDGHDYPSHRAILSANSSYFRAMFGGNHKESCLHVVNIQKISASTMGLLLDYMYGGHLTIQEDNVEGILQASDLLHIDRLLEACVKFLENQLHPCNCVGIMKFADSFSIASLSEKSKKVMLEGFAEVSCHEEFLELSKEELVEYLTNEQLVVAKEEAVFEAVMRWVNNNQSSRRQALRELLEHVKLPLLDPTYFLEKVEMDKTIRGCTECFPLLHEARMYYILGNEDNSFRTRPRCSSDLSEVIVIIGGCDKKGLLKLPYTESYRPKTRQWTSLPSLPGYSKSEFAACALKNNIYISGGHINSSEAWMLNTQLNVWIKIAPLNKGRWRHRMAALKGGIYAVGGFDGARRLSSVERYSAFSNSWSEVCPLLEAVSSAALVTCMNKLYVISGAVDEYANTDKVQCFDPADNKWTFLAPSPFSQRCISGVALDGVIYVVGGMLCTVFSYDPAKDVWSEVINLPGPLESCGLAVCAGNIYILGGSDESGEGTDKAFVFGPKTRSLHVEPPLQRCISYHGCVTILQKAEAR